MSTTANPYAAPTARVDDASPNAEAEAIRREHINHEASLKAVGFLYYIGGVLLTIGGLATAPTATTSSEAAIGLLVAAVGVLQLAAGWGVRALRPWGRTVGAIVSILGLLGFPLGTIINAYILYLYFSKKGRMIFSVPYQEVVAATPHVKYKTSIVVWILLALIVALFLFAGLGAFLGK